MFAVNTDGTGFTNLHNFSGGSDGAYPLGGLILSGNTLYGTASQGGSSGNGTVFGLNTDGTSFTTLHSFAAGADISGAFGNVYTNSDGTHPQAGLILLGNTLYGTATGGGSAGNGTVFSLSFRPQLQIAVTSGGAYTVLSWPTGVAGFSYGGYRAQATINLGTEGFVTVNLHQPPIISNGRYVVTIANTFGSQRFYRLSNE